MAIRRMQLPYGWYPHTGEELRKTLKGWTPEQNSPSRGRSGIVPHAGWLFSGELAYKVISSLLPEADTIIVAGGHLGLNSPVIAEMDDEYETPLGTLSVDGELRDKLMRSIPLQPDRYVDNTVEVQMPMVHYLWPQAKVLPLRLPPSTSAEEVGKLLGKICRDSGREAVFLGSTDLTHYGPSYNFMPMGTGNQAIDWVKNENDGSILSAMTAMDIPGVLECGNDKQAACSAGAAVGAIAFAAAHGIEEGQIVDYRTSLDKNPSESFVGYGGILYQEG